jgi:hypothetical protein
MRVGGSVGGQVLFREPTTIDYAAADARAISGDDGAEKTISAPCWRKRKRVVIYLHYEDSRLVATAEWLESSIVLGFPTDSI